jgi:ribosomal protein L2
MIITHLCLRHGAHTNPYKKLAYGQHNKKGQNNKGITNQHRKGGHKRLYQQIDFRQNKNKYK